MSCMTQKKLVDKSALADRADGNAPVPIETNSVPASAKDVAKVDTSQSALIKPVENGKAGSAKATTTENVVKPSTTPVFRKRVLGKRETAADAEMQRAASNLEEAHLEASCWKAPQPSAHGGAGAA